MPSRWMVGMSLSTLLVIAVAACSSVSNGRAHDWDERKLERTSAEWRQLSAPLDRDIAAHRRRCGVDRRDRAR